MPRKAFWDLTNRCNLKCLHCYNSEKLSGRKAGLGPDLTLKGAKDAVDRFSRSGIRTIHFLGGEPFLSEHLLELSRYVRSKGVDLSITTNGTVLPEAWIAAIGELGLTNLFVSLDGLSAEINDRIRGTGTFRKVVRNVSRIRDVVDSTRVGTVIRLSYTITRTNLASTMSLPEFLTEHGFHGATLGVVTPDGNASREPGLTEIEPTQWCEMLDGLYERFSRFPRLNLRLSKMKPAVMRYFIVKYPGHGMVIDRQSLSCPAFDTNVFLRSDGMLFPCSPLDFVMSGASLHVDGHASQYVPDAGVSVFDADLENGSNNPQFERFLGFVHSPDTYSHSASCRECDFWKRCHVCPLYDYSVQGRMIACDWARARFAEYQRSLLDAIPRFSDDLCSVNRDGITHVMSRRLGKVFRLNDTAVEILKRTDGRKRLSEIVKAAQEVVLLNGRDPITSDQVLSFYVMLCENNLLHFVPSARYNNTDKPAGGSDAPGQTRAGNT